MIYIQLKFLILRLYQIKVKTFEFSQNIHTIKQYNAHLVQEMHNSKIMIFELGIA